MRNFPNININIFNTISDHQEIPENINNIELPAPLYFLYTYSNNLKFNKDPDYNFLIKGFYNYLKLID